MKLKSFLTRQVDNIVHTFLEVWGLLWNKSCAEQQKLSGALEVKLRKKG